MTIVGVLAIASLLLAFVTKSSGNEGSEQFLTVIVKEAPSVSGGSFILIIDENGKQELVELEKVTGKREPFLKNAIQINKTLNKIGDQGYKLVAQSGGNDQYVHTTAYTFVKK